MFKKYDIIVAGGGHAGCEAAAAAANLGCSVLLITQNLQTIGQMSCNPAMGGVAKGQLVREIDALGGYSGIVTDKTRIQFRMLNRSKGQAMWSPRAQSDRMAFAAEWRKTLEGIPNLDFYQDMVVNLIIKSGQCSGVITSMGIEIHSEAVILTNGTFLNGLIHIGEKQIKGGRSGESASYGITEQLVSLGFESGRMKTGTPPRIDGRSIDYTKLEVQEGDTNPGRFSYLPIDLPEKQKPCYITYTNEKVHDILKKGFEYSPMFAGRIQGLGPRYCPSIEDKIVRFSEKNSHQLFIEPEGWDTVEIYLNGFSSSLPENIQFEALQKIPGLESVKLFRPGYAIEYDYFPPNQLKLNLETHLVEFLFFAGQINGTTGYEEAASQGIMAGINAALKIHQKNPFVLKRDEAFVGVLIDDLITKGTEEPYRMFTSRAEYRIMLRQDNADLRLTERSFHIGLASEERYNTTLQKKKNINNFLNLLLDLSIDPEKANNDLEQIKGSPLRQKTKAYQVLSRPEVSLEDILNWNQEFKSIAESLDEETKQQIEIQCKYASYIEKEREIADKMSRLDSVRLPENFDFYKINSLSAEGKEKLQKVKPQNLGQASRISGVSPADISTLMVFIGR
jgi:tRNA uridine 5-carboxymethylaminomethyl modification enzyme